MKSFISSKFKYYILAIATCLFLGAGLFGVTNAKASTDATSTLYLPQTSMEYYSLTSPIDGYLWDNNAAIIQGDNTLHVYYNGNYSKVSLNTLQQVKKFNEDYLIVSDSGILYKVDYKNLDTPPVPLNDDTDTPVGANYFDINQNYLITSYGTSFSIYQLNDGAVIKNVTEADKRDTSTPVCISDTNEIFYIHDGKICKYGIYGGTENEVATASPSAMAVVDNYLYYSVSSGIYRVSTNGGEPVKLTVSQTNYDLGNLVSPHGICVKNGKLIITDMGLNAVQEFAIDESDELNPKLAFTGFAIAKGKTAFNRMANSVSLIEKYDDKVLAVDQNKVTVIFDGVKKNYLNKTIIDLGLLNNPTVSALGKDTALFSDGTSVSVLNLEKSDENKTASSDITANGVSADNVVTSAYYQSGYYIFTAFDSVNELVTVYRLKENELVAENLFSVTATTQSLVAMDYFGNIFLTVDGEVLLFHNGENGYDANSYITVTTYGNTATQMELDARGGIYFFDQGAVTYFDGTATSTFVLKSDVCTSPAKAIAMDTISKNAYAIFEGEEIISFTDGLNNACLDDYATNKLLYKPLDYIVAVNYKGAPATAYIATDVNLYHLPLVTEDGDFAAVESGNGVRLGAGLAFSPINKITFDNQDFYYAYATVNGTQYEGYIPVSFTTLTLNDSVLDTTFTLAKVNATKVYSDKALSVKVADLTANSQVRILSVKDGVATIQYKVDDAWLNGYISADAIIVAPNTAIRNVLIILALCLSLAGTALFFVLRKKN